MLPQGDHNSLFINEIPKWGEPYPNILNRQSVLECLTDYLLQVNYRGYRPDPRKVLAVRQSDRTATLRNASAPIRQEVYYFIEGEIFPKEGTTRMKVGQSPSELAEELLVQHYERLYIWVAYDFTKGSPPGFRKPFDNPLIIKGSSCPNPEQVNRRQAPEGVNPRFFLPDPLAANIGDGGISPDVALDEIASFVTDLVKRDFRNALPEGDNPPIWDEPLIGIASATDPLFERFQDPEVVGPCHRFPEEWLPGARSVISVFLPFTGHISENYSRSQRYSAVEFSSGKWNGSKFLNVVRRALVRFAESHGASAVAPNIDPRYDSDGWLPFWSERHAALAAGLGTFGLHQNFISEKGAFGRLCSVVTTLNLKPTERRYTEVYGYCLYAFDGSCRACINRCPTGAITDAGKIPGRCETHGNKEHLKDWNYGSCGHCSTWIPCSRGIPAKIRKTL
ncbi:iron-sulfur cluster-binding oxidoreductase [Geotalea daltonii FRC-32]|uniref:Iron-sulfur cluster-binding oxidoreductase n=1 Tax=Geotalea daltonii (strain DSM 22248 / JCM 15807 / FRC-32) TaxID=316067 RepID=B9M0N6_GEODF|nr:epoxyqueuosine reductase [Geotalea daltonii]ACM20889.1 iron-sulfur cluster-binding oxidoreductase [Geotalea daltonii FRC-32]